jgi:hypothetical protein
MLASVVESCSEAMGPAAPEALSSRATVVLSPPADRVLRVESGFAPFL